MMRKREENGEGEVTGNNKKNEPGMKNCSGSYQDSLGNREREREGLFLVFWEDNQKLLLFLVIEREKEWCESVR